MKMHNPPHPGEVLRELCLEPLNLTVTAAARSLGVSRKALSSILNGRAGISPEMAVRLSMAFNTSAESWLNQQLQYDLWHAEKKPEIAPCDEIVRSLMSTGGGRYIQPGPYQAVLPGAELRGPRARLMGWILRCAAPSSGWTARPVSTSD